MTTYFVTGGNRGIGYEFVKQFSEADLSNVIITSVRDLSKATTLTELASKYRNILIITLDLNDSNSIEYLTSKIADITDGIDVFISNAAIADAYYKVVDAPKQVWLDHYVTNTLGPILVFQKVYPFMLKRQTRKVAFISSVVGSLTSFMDTSSSAYAQSKAALNFTMKALSIELSSENFIIIATSPGIVLTDMGSHWVTKFKEANPEVDLTSYIVPVEDTVKKQIELFKNLSVEDNGAFLNFTGDKLPY